MKIDNIDINKTLEEAKILLAQEKNISVALKAVFSVLLIIVELLINRLTLNSKNSSKPPASDPNRDKTPKGKSNKPRGGQNEHVGTTLMRVDEPDEIVELPVDRAILPQGDYCDIGYDARQVVHLKISRHVIEYRAQMLQNINGKKWIAAFPEHVTRPIQYGTDLKAHVVYLSQHQLLPYNRIEHYFRYEVFIAISQGSLYRFNQEAYQMLYRFDVWVKVKLTHSTLLHVDETGININAKLHWLHAAVNEKHTYFYPHMKRGNEATKAIGILPNFKGTLCHDHWKPYFYYECTHSLCNAHHLRELERAFEQDHQQWAKAMQSLLCEMNNAANANGGTVAEAVIDGYYQRYQAILLDAEKECPLPAIETIEGKKKRGRVKKSKARNLLERLIHFQKETLRFMEELDVPFTNNLAERHIRMTKVHQKVSGCFRSMEGAYIFCRIRSYLSTCQKHDISATEALNLLFEGKTPQFMLDDDWLKVPEKPNEKDSQLLGAE